MNELMKYTTSLLHVINIAIVVKQLLIDEEVRANADDNDEGISKEENHASGANDYDYNQTMMIQIIMHKWNEIRTVKSKNKSILSRGYRVFVKYKGRIRLNEKNTFFFGKLKQFFYEQFKRNILTTVGEFSKKQSKQGRV